MSGSAGNIKIEPAELRTLATNIGTQKKNLNDRVEDIQKQMNDLNTDGWVSQAGEDLRKKFNNLRQFYSGKYPPAMDAYIKFLNETATQYEEAEEQLKRDVGNLKEKV